MDYKDVRLQPINYQDDILRASVSIEDARAGVMKMEAMTETKLLNFNVKKSNLVILGSKKQTVTTISDFTVTFSSYP